MRGAEHGFSNIFTVYLIQSLNFQDKKYIGYTTDLDNRLYEHNSGRVAFTKSYRPWDVIIAIKFKDKQKAKAFERYLKHGSGHAFAKKRFW